MKLLYISYKIQTLNDQNKELNTHTHSINDYSSLTGLLLDNYSHNRATCNLETLRWPFIFHWFTFSFFEKRSAGNCCHRRLSFACHCKCFGNYGQNYYKLGWFWFGNDATISIAIIWIVHFFQLLSILITKSIKNLTPRARIDTAKILKIGSAH